MFTSNSGGRAADQNWGNTGAPGDQTLGANPRTCISCHGVDGSSGITVDLNIEIKDGNGNSITTSGYIGGETYDVTVTINATNGSPSGYGFQIVDLAAELNQNGPQAGTWSAPGSNVQIATASNTGRSYAEQNGISASGEFNMKWTAPAARTGTVTFYSCGNGVNSNMSTNGDGAACGTLVLAENPTSSAKELSQFVQLDVFPNPVENQLYLKTSSTTNGRYQIAIIDASGRNLKSQNIQLNSGESRHEIDVQDLSSGTYFLQLNGEKGSLTQTIVKL